jgi:hypothetical protein
MCLCTLSLPLSPLAALAFPQTSVSKSDLFVPKSSVVVVPYGSHVPMSCSQTAHFEFRILLRNPKFSRETFCSASPRTDAMEWEELRRGARTLEADIDAKLIAFNRLSVSQVLVGRRARCWAPPLPPSPRARTPPVLFGVADGEANSRRVGGLTAKRTCCCTMAN